MRVFLLILTVWLFIVVLRQAKMKKKSNQQPDERTDKQKNIPSSTIKCEYCGVYIPQQEAIRKQDHYYCSEKHALLSNNKNSD